MQRRRVYRCFQGLALVTAFLLSVESAWAQGILLNGVGPVNRSMAGASTAAPLDAMGALHWNPASISGFAGPQINVGLEFLLPTAEVTSSTTVPIPLTGTDGGEPGVATIPAFGWVQRIEDTPWTVGLGFYGIGGFQTNYPGSSLGGTANPILLPPPNGLGGIYAEAKFMQVVPTLSYSLTECFSIGIAPTLTLGDVMMDPLLVTNPTGGVYPSGTHGRTTWGGGFQAGIFYEATPCLAFGASFKSPQWMEDFRFNAMDTGGANQLVKYDLDLPMILSVGTSYTGIRNTVIAADVRYFDYYSSDGFGEPALFGPTGALLGLGWDSVFSISTGIHRQITDMWSLRFGYTFQENPIHASDTLVNLASPLITEHVASVGTSIALTRNVNLDVTYIHGFENSITGPMTTPGSSVTSQITANALSFGLTVNY